MTKHVHYHHRIICEQRGRYIGWPTVARDLQDRLHVVFSGDRDGHVCPFGKSFYMASDDEGESWSEPAVINDTPFDDRDTGLCVHPDGTLIMTWFTSHYYGSYCLVHAEGRKAGKELRPWDQWKQKIRRASELGAFDWAPQWYAADRETAVKWRTAAKDLGYEPVSGCDDSRYSVTTRRQGNWSRRSTDGGKSWDDPTPSPVSTPHGASVMANGNLIYAGTLQCPHTGVPYIGIAQSGDYGNTWRLLSVIPAQRPPDASGASSGGHMAEPHVIETSPGNLLVMARFEASRMKDRYLYQTTSSDGGKTWKELTNSGVFGYPPFITKLRDGRLLLSYAVRTGEFGQRYSLSENNGMTWRTDQEIRLPVAPNSDLGYPSTVQLSDDSVLSIYYQPFSIDNKPCLMASRFRLP